MIVDLRSKCIEFPMYLSKGISYNAISFGTPNGSFNDTYTLVIKKYNNGGDQSFPVTVSNDKRALLIDLGLITQAGEFVGELKSNTKVYGVELTFKIMFKITEKC